MNDRKTYWLGPKEINYLLLYVISKLGQVGEEEISSIYYGIKELIRRDDVRLTPLYTDGQAIDNLCMKYWLLQTKMRPPRFVIGPDAPPLEEIENNIKKVSGETYNAIIEFADDMKKRKENPVAREKKNK